MIIKKDSPLRQIPFKLNDRQTLFLDAIRYSIEMTDASYNRLKRTLLNITKKGLLYKTSSQHTVSALIDVWSIIDNVDRMRKLFDYMPGIKKGATGLVVFMKKTAEVHNLRNIIQHLNKKDQVEDIIKTKSAAFGSLTWNVASNTKQGNFYACYLRPGTLRTKTTPFPIDTGNINYPIDKIRLSIGSKEVCISDIFTSLIKLTSSIERNLKGQFKGLPKATIDIFTCLEINKGKKQ